jgi:hypothetical protein
VTDGASARPDTELSHDRQQSALDEDTYVWADGMDDFSQVKAMHDLRAALATEDGVTLRPQMRTRRESESAIRSADCVI